MSRSRVLDLTVTATVIGGVAVAVAHDETAGADELLFGSVLLLSLYAVLRLAARAGRRAFAEGSRARELESLRDGDVARSAVAVERARLAADIQVIVRTAATAMRGAAEDAARSWEIDPAPALHAVQREGERASVELRRLLGLLREAEDSRPPAIADPPRHARLTRSDVILALAVSSLALAEHLLYAGAERPGIAADVMSGVLTVAAASTIVFRRRAPGRGAAACGVLFAVSVWASPISSGFWVLATVGGLAWAAVRGPGLRPLIGLVVLWAGVAAGGAARDPDNLPIDLQLLAVATATAAVVRCSEAWGRSARARADRRAAELAAASAAAVRAERLAVARELHDLVSHAVGVMVVQAGAALATRSTDPARARRALDLVRQTAEETLTELDRLVDVFDQGVLGAAVAAPVRHDAAELVALTERMRGAGLDVRLTVDGDPPGDSSALVYRVVQESLTNVLRHAPGAVVVIHVGVDGADDVSVEVVDDGPGPAADSRHGYGLVGIAERVHRVGGELSAGPRGDGSGFRVSARVPAQAGSRT